MYKHLERFDMFSFIIELKIFLKLKPTLSLWQFIRKIRDMFLNC